MRHVLNMAETVSMDTVFECIIQYHNLAEQAHIPTRGLEHCALSHTNSPDTIEVTTVYVQGIRCEEI